MSHSCTIHWCCPEIYWKCIVVVLARHVQVSCSGFLVHQQGGINIKLLQLSFLNDLPGLMRWSESSCRWGGGEFFSVQWHQPPHLGQPRQVAHHYSATNKWSRLYSHFNMLFPPYLIQGGYDSLLHGWMDGCTLRFWGLFLGLIQLRAFYQYSYSLHGRLRYSATKQSFWFVSDQFHGWRDTNNC